MTPETALEVTVDGLTVGVYVPPPGGTFAAMLGNVPRTHMRANVTSGNDVEVWSWQLPDIQPGQSISFRLVVPQGLGVPPQSVQPCDPAEAADKKRQAKLAYEQAMRAKRRGG